MAPIASQAVAADVAVVGGGPAGLMAAIAVAERGRRVVVLEQLDRPGAKLLASGGGRCNLTNTLPPADFLARFGRQGRFMQPALEAFGAAALRCWFDSLGVATHAPDGLHVYPVSNSAVTVQSALWRRAKRLGVAVRLATRASCLWIEQGAVRGLETSRGRVAASRVILASGGRGYPALGGSAVGYDLARQAGHTVTDLVPALVPLLVREAWVRGCAGVSLPARVWIDLPRRPHAGAAGNVLFTHRGLSGPVVLDLSGEVSALLARRETVPLRLDLSLGTTAAEWLARFDAWERSAGRKTFAGLLEGRLPRRLAAALCGLAEIAPGARPS
jgi:predicted Rossmann fold flavoprotein